MKLISTTSYVAEYAKETPTIGYEQFDWYYAEQQKLEKIRSYCKFLSMPLSIGQFIPVDENGNVIHKPICLPDLTEAEYKKYTLAMKAYNAALDNVIFEGVVVQNNTVLRIAECGHIIAFTSYGKEWIFSPLSNIENLIPYGLTIKESAVTKYNLK